MYIARPEVLKPSVSQSSQCQAAAAAKDEGRRAGNNNVTASKMVNNDAGGTMPSTFLCVRKLGALCRCEGRWRSGPKKMMGLDHMG